MSTKAPPKSVRDVLLDKHPPAKALVPSAVCEPDDDIADRAPSCPI